METRAPLLPPPDITITREDVRALPTHDWRDTYLPEPTEGRTWHLVRMAAPSRELLVWVELPSGLPLAARCTHMQLHDYAHSARHLSPVEGDVAERAYLWQIAHATDVALTNMATDADMDAAAAVASPAPRSTFGDTVRQAADIARAMRAALERSAGRA